MAEQLITLKNFSVTLDNASKRVIKNINLSLYPGEIFGIIGPSGAGKTTFLKAIALLIDKEAINGEYIYDDVQVFPSSNDSISKLEKIRKNLVFIHQEPVLFNGTVWYNLEYGLRIRKMKENKHVLDSYIESFNIKPLLNRHAHSLSSGEKQRVCLARAMALKPRVLILDEPTQNLDPSNVANIEKNIQKFLETDHRIVIIATHNFFQARRIADRTAILIGGQIIEVEETETLFSIPKSPLAADFLTGKIIF